VCLRGHLSDELREVNFCRIRLGELSRMLEEPVAAENLSAAAATGQRLFPSGCKGLAEAVDQFLAGLTPEAVHEFEARVQVTIKTDFHSLVNICLTDAGVLKNVQVAVLQAAREFVGSRLPPTDVAELFLEQNHDDEGAVGDVAGFFREAAPELAPGRTSRLSEVCVLAAPSGPAGDKFRELARAALPTVEIHPAAGTDDVVIYRELTNLPLTDLEQLGPVGQDAYRQMNSAENFSAHSRMDVDFGSRHG
jgi:hypothetical protein